MNPFVYVYLGISTPGLLNRGASAAGRVDLDDGAEGDASELCFVQFPVPVCVAGKDDVWLFVTSVTELPPIVWVAMVRRVRAAG